MFSLQHRPRIAKGDLVIVYENFQSQHAVRVTPPQVFSSKFGKFSHAAMVGRRYGEKMIAVSGGSSSSGGGGGGGFVYLLSPSPELWTATLPHRTQILYIADISMICLQLELVSGSVVVEAGTGSGSLSHALARSVGARGHLHTFEFNAHRAQLAAAEFAANDLADRVTCLHGDVCTDGWDYSAHGIREGSVDGVIFDLPQPWDAVRIFAPYMKPGGRLCCFSPCIEQVARTLDVLRDTGFTGVEVIEAIVRSHEVQRPAHQADAISLAVAQAAEAKQARQQQLAEAAEAPTDASAATAEEPKADGTAAGAAAGEGDADSLGAAKRPREDGEADADAAAGAAGKRPKVNSAAAMEEQADGQSGGGTGGGSSSNSGNSRAARGGPGGLLRTKPNADMRGHTGFLVFCTKHVG